MQQIILDPDPKRRAQFATLFSEFQTVSEILQDDFQIAHADFMALVDERRLPYAYRTLVRTLFPWMDHALHNLRQAVRTFPQHHCAFTPKEWGMLAPEAKIPARDSIKSAFQLVAKAFVFTPVSFSDNGFESLLKASEQRNGFMHPKAPDDIAVTPDRTRNLAEGGMWLANAFGYTVGTANANLVEAMKRHGFTT